MHISKNRLLVNIVGLCLIVDIAVLILMPSHFDKYDSNTWNEPERFTAEKLQKELNNLYSGAEQENLFEQLNEITSNDNINSIIVNHNAVADNAFPDTFEDINDTEKNELDRFLALSDSIQAETGTTVVFNSFTSHLPSTLQMDDEQTELYNSIVADLNKTVKELMEYLYSDHDINQTPDKNTDKLIWFSQEQKNIDLQFKNRLSAVLYSEQFEKYLSLSKVERSLFGPLSLINTASSERAPFTE